MKMRRLVAELEAQRAEATRLDAAIGENLKALGFDPPGVHTAVGGERGLG